MRLIDADELMEELRDIEDTFQDDAQGAEMILALEKAHTVDPVKHGRWMLNRFGEYDCSVCKSCIALSEDWHGHPNYCPNCGAKMDEVSECADV